MNISMKITIYTTKSCGYCRRAEELLNRHDIPFEKIDVTHNASAREDLIDRAEGRMTVPVIFFDDKVIGGYQELAALESQGKLPTRST